MPLPLRLTGLLVLTSAFGACIDTSARGCPVVPDQSSNDFDLSYEVTAPHECPAPISIKGEPKSAAGIVTDNGNSDFVSELLTMYNSDDELLNDGSDLFQLVSGKYQAQPVVSYKGATGHDEFLPEGSRLPDPIPADATDYGRFEAIFWSGGPAGGIRPSGLLRIPYEYAELRIAVSGTEIPLRNTTETWTATVSGGGTPYAYKWFREGQLVSQASSYSGAVGTSDFGLRVESTDPGQQYGRADLWIDVDGIRATISGPSTVYASQGGGTWRASAQGGSAAYAYKWYVENAQDKTSWLVGTGSSWSGYPGEGLHLLHAIVTNGTEHQYDAVVKVYGIGGSTCTPEPPAVTC